MSLRKAAEALLEYRRKAGPLGYQLEKADDHHRALRAALDSPDLADELATALRILLRHSRASRGDPYHALAIEAARAVLRRYDDSRKEQA